MQLTAKGWISSPLWNASPPKIQGNKQADERAKKGAEETLHLCSHAFTSKNRIRNSRQYPASIKSMPFNGSRAIFSPYCGRTPSDPHCPYDLTPCQCGTTIHPSSHLITSCHLLDYTRAIKSKNY
jgi:hypothetical protein